MADGNISKDELSSFIEESQRIEKVQRLPYVECWPQVLACSIAFSTSIQVGANMSYSSILLPQLGEKDSPIKITKEDASWIASIVAIALPLGSLIVGPFMDIFGRKKLCILLAVPFTVAWLFQIFAKQLWHMYVARVIAGFTGGLTTVVLVYVTEIAHPTLRPALLSLNSVFVSLGVLLTYFFGSLLRWKLTAILMATCAVLVSFGMLFMPESPHWLLVFKNDSEGAQKTFRWLYKNGSIADAQYREMTTKKRYHDKNEETRDLQLGFRVFAQKSVYKPTIILSLIFVAQQITGGYVLIFYATDIFRKMVGQNPNQAMNDFTSLVLLGLIRFLSSVVSAVISKNVGRRPILISSGVGMAFCSFCAGLYVYFTLLPNEQIAAMNITATDKTYNIAFFFLLGYVAFGSLGFLVIPWTLIGELLPIKVRGVIGGALVSWAYLLMFVFVKVFLSILDSIDIHCIFYVVAIFNLFSVVFVYLFLPETFGKNFREIEEYFER